MQKMEGKGRHYPLAEAEERASRAEALLKAEHHVRLETEAKRSTAVKRVKALEAAVQRSEVAMTQACSRDAQYQAELRKKEREYSRCARHVCMSHPLDFRSHRCYMLKHESASRFW